MTGFWWAFVRGLARVLDVTGRGRTRRDYSLGAQLARVADDIARARAQAEKDRP